MILKFEAAPAHLSAEYIRLRGITRENAVSEQRLSSLGITAESWAEDVRSSRLCGFVACSNEMLAGYCFGNTTTGEVVVLALKPEFEGQGVGKRLLALVVEQLRKLGHTKPFLGCSSDPTVRSYGFYRHLGWRSTGAADEHGDEILELSAP